MGSLSGVRLKKRDIKHQAYREYLDAREVNFKKLKKLLEDESFVVNAEWYGDGKWQFSDDLVNVEPEDWEIWADWFPDE